jgi:thioredoxin-related protein|tara:strand:- start:23404 stop:23931 length:528 start_codon:yes stop_codon:yes gene_type:complete
MNRIIKTIIICFFVGFLNGQDTILSKDEVMNVAYAEAEQEGKNVFLMFDASWCGWCKRMDKNMKNNACKNFFDDNYVTVHLAIKESKENKHLENPGAPDFYDSLKEGTSGIPFWVIFDSKGNVLDNSLDSNNNNIGSPVTKDEVQAFVSILKGTSKLNDKELSIITEVFWDKAYD